MLPIFQTCREDDHALQWHLIKQPNNKSDDNDLPASSKQAAIHWKPRVRTHLSENRKQGPQANWGLGIEQSNPTRQEVRHVRKLQKVKREVWHEDFFVNHLYNSTLVL